jgi:hypothetical protein
MRTAVALLHSPARSTRSGRTASAAMRDEQRREFDQSRRDVLTGIIGARRVWTVSMISALSMPWR